MSDGNPAITDSGPFWVGAAPAVFTRLAGGHQFGSLGVLLALPAAAVAMVLMREAHRRYPDSERYRGDPSLGAGGAA